MLGERRLAGEMTPWEGRPDTRESGREFESGVSPDYDFSKNVRLA